MRICILIITAMLFSILNPSCSMLNRIVYHPDVNQGNYFTASDILKIHPGLTKEQILHILGTPMVTDPCNPNIWFYICRQNKKYQKKIQSTLILTFRKNGTLKFIEKKNFSIKQ